MEIPYSKPRGKKRLYVYRRRVPSDLVSVVGETHWKIALKTSDPVLALERAARLVAEHNAIISRHLGMSEPARLHIAVTTAERKGGKVFADSPMFTRQVVDKRRDAVSIIKAKMLEKAAQRVVGLSESERVLIDLAGGVGALLEGVEIEEAFAQALAELVPDTVLIEPDEIISLVETRKRRQKLDFEKAERAVNQKDVRERRQVLKKLDLIADDDPGPEDPDNPRITTVLEKWLAHKKQGPHARQKHRVTVRRFVEKFGNVPVKEITQSMVLQFRDYCETFPDVRKLPAKDRVKPLSELVGKDVPVILPNTVERYLVSLKALLKWSTVNVAGFGSENVGRGIVAAVDKRKQRDISRAFTAAELQHVFANIDKHFDMTKRRYRSRLIDMNWLVWVGTYSGCRLEELCQLARANVRQEKGIWVFDVNDRDGRKLKNEFSERLVPVHPVLIDKGFIDWATKGNGSRVFSSFVLRQTSNGPSYGGPASTSFARFMDRIDLKDSALKFHSLRHGFIQALRNAQAPYSAELALVGHADKVSPAHAGYGGPAGVTVLAEVMRRVDPFGE